MRIKRRSQLPSGFLLASDTGQFDPMPKTNTRIYKTQKSRDRVMVILG